MRTEKKTKAQLIDELAVLRRRMAELEEIEEKYHDLFEHTSDAIFVIDPATLRFIDVNARAAHCLGYTRAELLGLTLGDIDATVPALPDADAVYERLYRRKDGVTIPVEVNSRPIQYGGRRVFQNLVRDITERRWAAEAFRANEARYRALFEQANDAIILENANEEIIDVNRRACTLTGYSRGEMLSMKMPDLEPEELHGHGIYGSTAHFEHILLHRDGRRIPVEVTTSPLTNENEDEALYISILRDITDRKQAEDERERLIVDLNAFAHTVAHDLKNPLGITISSADILAYGRHRMSEEKVEHYLQAIVRNGYRMSTIIDELLFLSSVRALTEVPTEPINMAQIIATTQNRMVSMFAEYKAKINVPSHFPVALGYAPWIEEVWANYFSNALKYGGNPPRLDLGAAVLPGGMVRFWVSDNGPGITSEGRARLFTPFTRLNVERVEGHGLGLSIVQRIIDKLGGEVGVESTHGEGSTFSFTLPGVDKLESHTI